MKNTRSCYAVSVSVQVGLLVMSLMPRVSVMCCFSVVGSKCFKLIRAVLNSQVMVNLMMMSVTVASTVLYYQLQKDRLGYVKQE